jgi:hypothetical protein
VELKQLFLLQYPHYKFLSDIFYINLLLNTVQMFINKTTFRKLSIYESVVFGELSAISKQNSGTNKLKLSVYSGLTQSGEI